MTGLPDVVSALAAQLQMIGGLRVTDHVPDDTEYPAAFVVPPEIDYRQTFRLGAPRFELDIVVLVGTAAARLQKGLFEYLDWEGARSIPAAIESDKTLGLTGVDCTVMASRPLGEEEMAGYRAYGAAISTVIIVTNPENP